MTQQPTTLLRPAAVHARPSNAIVAGAIGNALEWYDFGVYVYLATFMSQLFFPARAAGLLLTFSTFALGYLARPVGSVIVGHIGDRVGRRAALSLTVVVMAVATFAVGLLPTYASVGVLAPVLLVVLRLVQGLAAGGEWGGAATYLIEHAGPGRRGFATSWQQFTVLIGTLLGSGIAAALTGALAKDQMLAYGWRIPFLLGLVLGAVGIYMRARAPETAAFQQVVDRGEVESRPLARMWTHRRAMLQIIGLCAQWDVTFTFYLNYAPTYFNNTLGFSASYSLVVTSVAIAVVAVLVPFVGLLSDRVGRRPLLAAAGVISIVITLPLFVALQHASAGWGLLILIVMVLPLALLSGTAPAALCELVPTRIRYSSLSIPYSVAVAVFAGLTPLIVTALLDATGSALSVTAYVIAAAIVGLITVASMPETGRRELS